MAQVAPVFTETDDSAAALDAALTTRLEQVLARLQQEGIPYCLLRNRHLIPSGLATGADVDLVVPTSVKAERLTEALEGLHPTQVFWRRSVATYYFAAGPRFLKVDIAHGNQQWRGAVYLQNQEILAGAWDDDGLPVASEVHQACAALCEKLIGPGVVPQRYEHLIARAAAESPDELRALLDRAFGRQLGSELFQLAIAGDVARFEPLFTRCRRALWRRAVRRHPFATLGEMAANYAQEFKLLFRPPGLAVAFFGPDGAGKTTVRSLVAEAPVASVPFKEIKPQQHLLAVTLPGLAAVARFFLRPFPQSWGRPELDRNPHGKPPHSPAASVFKFTYYTIDQLLSEPKRRRKLARNPLHLHDRHMFEVAIVPRHHRFAGPNWLARLIARVIPKPDLVILLDSPAEVLQSRKQEVTFAESARQREVYRSVVGKMPNGRIVDGTQPLEKVAADARRLIVEFVAARTARRFGFTPEAPAAPISIAEARSTSAAAGRAD